MALDNADGQPFTIDYENVVISDSDIEDGEEAARDLVDFQQTIDLTLGQMSRKKQRAQKRKGAVDKTLPPHLSTIMGEAYNAYINHDFELAKRRLQDIITEAPGAFSAWKLMGTIWEELGNKQHAVQSYLVAAHMGKDRDFWKQIGRLAREIFDTEQAIYCYTKAIRLDPSDISSIWERCTLYLERNEQNKAINGFYQILKVSPTHAGALKELAKLLVKHQLTDRMDDLIERFESLFVVDETDPVYVPVPGTGEANRRKQQKKKKRQKSRKKTTLANGIEVTDDEAENEPEEEEEEENDNEGDDTLYVQEFRMGYEELNILAELLMLRNNHRRAAYVIKKGISRIIGSPLNNLRDPDIKPPRKRGRRPSSSSASAASSASESEHTDDEHEDNDDELNRIVDAVGSSKFPLELRVKLGICRVWLDQTEDARTHFRVLYQRQITSKADLYLEVAEAYLGRQMYSSAAVILDCLLDIPSTAVPVVKVKAAYCHHQLDDLEKAKGLYEDVLNMLTTAQQKKEERARQRSAAIVGESGEGKEAATGEVQPGAEEEVDDDDDDVEGDPELDIDVIRTALVGVYDDMGLTDKVAELGRQIEDKPKKSTRSRRAPRGETGAEKEKSNQTATTTTPAIPRPSTSKVNEAREKRAAERRREQEEERQRERENPGLFKRCETFWNHGIDVPETRADFRRSARRLLDRFIHHRAFYDRKNVPSDLNISIDPADLHHPLIGEWQGLTYQQWYQLFIRYAYTNYLDDDLEEAAKLIRDAAQSMVFSKHPASRYKLTLHAMALGKTAQNHAVVMEKARWLCTTFPCMTEFYKMYSGAATASEDALGAFSSPHNMKWCRRQIQMMDNKAKNQEKKRFVNLRFKNAALWALYGFMLQTTRSYAMALTFYFRALELVPEEPLLNLVIGICYMLLGTSRKTENRHFQIMQGYGFVMKYYKLRGKDTNQEACFNVARSFHQLNLTSLAVPFYEKVLEFRDVAPESDLKREAAYNLSLIYAESGSVGLAQQVLKRFLTV